MTTQTLRGMVNGRGPCTGGATAAAPSTRTNGDFSGRGRRLRAVQRRLREPARPGRGRRSTPRTCASFADFALSIVLPPESRCGPSTTQDTLAHRPRPAQLQHLPRQHPRHLQPLPHPGAAGAGFFGTSGLSVFDPGDFKIPHLRNVYDKVGAFGFNAHESRGGTRTRFVVGDADPRRTASPTTAPPGSIKTPSSTSRASPSRARLQGKDEVEDFVLEFPSEHDADRGPAGDARPRRATPTVRRADRPADLRRP